VSTAFAAAVAGTGLRHSQVEYGAQTDQIAEIVAPAAGSNLGLIVVIHGGFWRAQYDRGYTAAQCVALAHAGYAGAALEYRRVGGGGGWPATFLDVAAGTDALPGLLGGLVDPTNVILIGHSAGGHLALWAAGRHLLPPDAPGRRTEPAPLRGVIALGAVADLGWSFRHTLGSHAAVGLLGCVPADDPEGRWSAADPALLLPSGVRTILLHGEDDDAVPPGCPASYVAAARVAGDPSEFRLLPGVGHYEFMDPRSAAWPPVISAVDDLMRPTRA
jgi:acetyl esterase/lipase